MAKKIIIGNSCGDDCKLDKTPCDGKLYGFRNNRPEEITGGTPEPTDDYVINGLNPNGVHSTVAANQSYLIEAKKFAVGGPTINGAFAQHLFDFDSDYIRMRYNDGTRNGNVTIDSTGMNFTAPQNIYKFNGVTEVSTLQFVYVEQNGILKKITTANLTNLLNIDLSNYYTKSEVYSKTETYNKTEVNNMINNLSIDIFIVASSLPSTGVANKIYLIPNSSSESDNVYNEYIWINNSWEKIGQMSLSLDGYYTKTEADNAFAPKSHTHAALTLQVAGTTKATYNAGTATTFNVTAGDLNVYTKDESYSKTEIDNKIPDTTNLKTISGSVISSSGGNETFSLIDKREIYKRINLNGASLQLIDSNPTDNLIGASILYSIKNITNADSVVTFPKATGYEFLGEVIDITIPAGKSVEIGIVAFGRSVRSLTYATIGFNEF